MAKKKTASRTKTKAVKPRSAQPKKQAANGHPVSNVRIRMYRQGLGDCFLLSFGTDPKLTNAAHVLVDCGTLGATTTGIKMADVVKDIATATNGKLSAMIATHEHLDHVSGFNSERENYDKLIVDNSWVAWTENPEDELAKQIAKYDEDLKVAALAAAQALDKGAAPGSPAAAMAMGLRGVLSFFGSSNGMGLAFAKGVNDAMNYVRDRAPEQARKFLEPGTFLQPDWLPGVTVFVLAPPRDITKIKNMGAHGSSELYELSAQTTSGFGAAAKLSQHAEDAASYYKALDSDQRNQLDLCYPFDERFRQPVDASDARMKAYLDAGQQWRRIDTDWLMGSADFALQLDNLTNNTSLVLAFEIGEDGPVILMAADAQLGNWLSWHDYTWKVPGSDGKTRSIQAKDLLARTLIYKVGHHSSHNATAVQHGLEMMTNKSLTALIPLDQQVAIKKKWPMPAEKLYERLLEKTSGRTLRSDIGWPRDNERPDSIPVSQWKKPAPGVDIQLDTKTSGKLYIDVNITA